MKMIGLTKQRDCAGTRLGFVVVLCIGLLLAGFSSTAMSAVKDVEDKNITNHIETEFWADDSVPSNAIDVTTNEGIVTLTGSVDNILAKDRALKIAEAMVGVRAVVNRITVMPPVTRTDDEIEKAVKNALLADPATDSYEVNVNVDDGVIKLTGTVDSWQEKQLCTTVAKGVKGVIDVKNDVTVDYKMERSDYEIEQEVKQRLANDIRVDDALINVKVKDEKVILTGTVGSLQEKTRARSDAWVGGVDSVDTDGLEVKWWARDDMTRKNLYVSRSDQEIKQAVKDAFVYDPRLYSFNVDVDVSYGKVTLGGIVEDLKAKKAAEQDAKNTMGVWRVKNNLKVRPKTIPSNDELKKRVSKAIFNDPYIERVELTISAYTGTVYLSGEVNTSWEKSHAERITEGVKGVVSVVNSIDYEHKWVWKPDWEIRDEVKDQLFWSPFVDENQVSVTVDNGIVTLTGDVDTYSERQSAEDNAYEGGAKDVKNKLTVTYRQYGPYYYGPYSPYGPHPYPYPYYYPVP
jgi:osmotically-inducible protein OsmY